MLEVMMALGPYRFSLSTAAYDQIVRNMDWRWPAQERIGKHPVRQSLGPGEYTITIDGTLYTHYKGLLGLPNLISRLPYLAAGLGYIGMINSGLSRVGIGLNGLGIPGFDTNGAWQLQSLYAAGQQGVPLLLVDGRGRNWGYWCLLNLQETEGRHLADGSPLRVDFAATLGYYGDTAPDALSADTSIEGAIRGVLGF
jgi:phage protein U